MLVFGTQVHLVTFLFILLETGMAIFQLALYLIRPKDGNRGLYLLMLLLMVFYNTTGGLFPDSKIAIPVPVQEMIAYGSGFLMASFLPYYFYKPLISGICAGTPFTGCRCSSCCPMCFFL